MSNDLAETTAVLRETQETAKRLEQCIAELQQQLAEAGKRERKAAEKALYLLGRWEYYRECNCRELAQDGRLCERHMAEKMLRSALAAQPAVAADETDEPACDISGICTAPAGATGRTNCIHCGKELLQRLNGRWYTWDATTDGKPQQQEIVPAVAVVGDEAESELSCACDLVNSWCRESSVEECKNPYGKLELRNAIDRLWSKLSAANAQLREQLAAAELELGKSSEALDAIAVALVGAKLPFSGSYSFKRETAAESMRAIIKQLEAGFAKQQDMAEELADRLKCLMGKLSNEEPREALHFAQRIDSGEDAEEVVREAISDWKSHFNYRCELDEENRRQLADLRSQLVDAQQAANDAQRSYRELNKKSIKQLTGATQRAEAAEQKAAALQAEVERLRIDRDLYHQELCSDRRILNRLKESAPASVEPAALPIGTRIRFIKQLDAEANEDHPRVNYAGRGELGTIVGHGASEGYKVKVDGWDQWFGAELGTEFVVEPAASEPAPAAAEVPIEPESFGDPWGGPDSRGFEPVDPQPLLHPTMKAAEPPATAGKSPGQVCYEAYHEYFRVHSNSPPRNWRECADGEKSVWEAAARAVLGMGEPRWIPVSESLPADFKTVMVQQLAYFDGARWWPRSSSEPLIPAPTHWQPLPAAPEQPAAVKESEVQR